MQRFKQVIAGCGIIGLWLGLLAGCHLDPHRQDPKPVNPVAVATFDLRGGPCAVDLVTPAGRNGGCQQARSASPVLVWLERYRTERKGREPLETLTLVRPGPEAGLQRTVLWSAALVQKGQFAERRALKLELVPGRNGWLDLYLSQEAQLVQGPVRHGYESIAFDPDQIVERYVYDPEQRRFVPGPQ